LKRRNFFEKKREREKKLCFHHSQLYFREKKRRKYLFRLAKELQSKASNSTIMGFEDFRIE